MHASGRKVLEVGDRVKVLDSVGDVVAEGGIVRLTQDSLFLEVKIQYDEWRFSLDQFRAGDLWLERRTGSKAAKWSLIGLVSGAALGGVVGYCVDAFAPLGSGDCEGNGHAAGMGFAYVGVAGLAVGALAGAMRSRLEHIGFDEAIGRASAVLSPALGPRGGPAIALAVRFRR